MSFEWRSDFLQFIVTHSLYVVPFGHNEVSARSWQKRKITFAFPHFIGSLMDFCIHLIRRSAFVGQRKTLIHFIELSVVFWIKKIIWRWIYVDKGAIKIRIWVFVLYKGLLISIHFYLPNTERYTLTFYSVQQYNLLVCHRSTDRKYQSILIKYVKIFSRVHPRSIENFARVSDCNTSKSKK